ncbi:hypothetical protein CMQ_89 [Grosmannia clavigera kw1407]|uniref:Uncharacterized protein n=1 Tax=Grosmannia clavigera (strain kw1407 / UAMH 11150) TaxID=655863 RepID=F0XQU6_GROCL|nr:uncharacterized protein CMQ_89 [Grosmannia clavigera kw1407]EFW99771.1 hypothetical protein CMQ_89 [Grosmannia clavigera kw1407]
MKDENPVDDEAHDDVEYTTLDLKSIRRKHCSLNLLSFSTGCLSTIALLAVAFFFHRSLATSPKSSADIEAEEWNHCGRSSAVAKARGCVMEPMFYGWMPPQCVYDELTKQYPVFEDRKYYSDPNLTEELGPGQLWAGEHSVVYTSR